MSGARPAELARPRQGSRRRPAGRLASQRACPASHRRGAARPAADPSAICGAARHALEITPTTETTKINRIRLNMDRWRWLPRDLGEQIHHRQRARLSRDAGRERRRPRWKHRAVAGAIKTPTPQLIGDWRSASSSIRGGKCRRASRRKLRGKAGYVAGQGQGRQDPALAPAAGADQCARPAQVRDVQSAEHLSARHQRPRAASTARCARSATAASAPSISWSWRPAADEGSSRRPDDGSANGPRTGSRRRWPARRPSRPIS